MKILHVNNIANVGPLLVKGLQELGEEAEFYNLRRYGSGLNPLGKIILSPLRFYEYLKLNKYIQGEKFDIIHIHFASQGVAGVLGNYPYVLHVHGSDIRKNLKLPIISQITKLAIRKAWRVFYSTPDLEQDVKAIRPDAIFLLNPIETKKYTVRAAMKTNNPNARILLFSRLDPIKGMGKAFESFKMIKKERPDVCIVALKLGSQFRYFQSKYGGIVTFCEKIPHEKIPEFINSFDVIVGQLNLGAIGVSELEVMAVGKPLITYFEYNKAYPEPAPLVSIRSTQELTTTLRGLLDNIGKTRKPNSRSQIWVKKYHDYLSVSRNLLNYYRNENINN